MSPLSAHLIYGLAWASFGAGHSLLAGQGPTQRLGKYARLTYNFVALVHIGIVLAIGGLVLDRQSLVASAGWSVVFYLIEGMGIIVFLVALRQYDLGLLSGLKQIRLGADAPLDEGKLHREGLHRYVRHPIYSGAFLLLWGGAISEIELATAFWGSVYLVIGTYFEERRLLKHFGGVYENYRKAVPAYIPWKGRVEYEGKR